MSRSDLRGDDEVDYLRQVELLALDVVDRAHDDGTLTYGPDRANETPLQAAVRALADGLRHYHFPGDGCVEEHPLLPLSGIVVIGPDSMPLHWDVEYADVCQRLGIPLRNEGWALWHAWDGKGRPITVVTSNLATTKGLLSSWSMGHKADPAQPQRAQVAAVVRGWIGPATMSPAHMERTGLADDPPVPDPDEA